MGYFRLLVDEARRTRRRVPDQRGEPRLRLWFWNNQAADTSSVREVDVEAMLDRKWPQQSWRGACLCRDAPEDLIACIGSYGQRLYIIPSRQIIIVRMAQDSSPNDARFLRLLFEKEKSGR